MVRRRASANISRVVPVMIMLIPTSVPITQRDELGQCIQMSKTENQCDDAVQKQRTRSDVLTNSKIDDDVDETLNEKEDQERQRERNQADPKMRPQIEAGYEIDDRKCDLPYYVPDNRRPGRRR